MSEAWIRILEDSPPAGGAPLPIASPPIRAAELRPDDPAALILTCANCGAAMDERKCKLICSCGYFLSCSDYY
ncbi:MAG TPA: hypothetical protein VGJ17_07555 [Candidatus Limnocylindrales bacterium]